MIHTVPYRIFDAIRNLGPCNVGVLVITVSDFGADKRLQASCVSGADRARGKHVHEISSRGDGARWHSLLLRSLVHSLLLLVSLLYDQQVFRLRKGGRWI
jgi:hypothetical protein